MLFQYKNILVLSLLVLLGFPKSVFAQKPGDTIRIKTFHYGTNNRDTIAYFPQGNLTFEKIILRYNLRCKNGIVSDANNRSKGCGEWDYSCNTFLVDSSKVEELTQKAPKYLGYFGKKLSPRPFKNSPIWSHCAHRGPKVLSEVK